VQNVESDSLTEGYKSKFPLFHKLFLSGVEKGGGTAGDWADVRSGNTRVIGPYGDRNPKAEQFWNSDDPITRWPDHPM